MLTLSQPANGLRSRALSRGDGPVVVCLHGFPDHAPTFEPLLGALSRAGFTGVAPWLRGYEPESQPRDGRFDVPALAGDVIAWLDALEVERAHVVGHDWGAVIAYELGQRHPHRLRTLTAMAVPWVGLPWHRLLRRPSQMRKSWYMGFFQWRGADAWVRRRRFALLERLWRSWSPGWAPDATFWDALLRTFEQPGVVAGTLGYYRAAFDLTSPLTRRWLAARAAPVRAPTLAISGATDGCIDTRLFDGWPPGAFPEGLRVERLEGAGHFAHLERSDRVNGLILSHIASWEGG